MAHYSISVYNGDVKIGIIKYPIMGPPDVFPKETTIDWLMNQIDQDFGNNWTSFEYHKQSERTVCMTQI